MKNNSKKSKILLGVISIFWIFVGIGLVFTNNTGVGTLIIIIFTTTAALCFKKDNNKIYEQQIQQLQMQNQQINEYTQQINRQNQQLNEHNQMLQKQIDDFGITEYSQSKAKLDAIQNEIATNNKILSSLFAEVEEKNNINDKLEKQISTAKNKLGRIKELYKSVEYSIEHFIQLDIDESNCKISSAALAEYDELCPTVNLKLHSMDMRELRKAYKDNEKQINTLLDKYSSRYTTKSNQAIYQLMVIAYRAELQNILYNLKYEKLDTSIEAVKSVSAKYLAIACSGNQSIAGTITKFIGEMEYLFLNAVKIEYNYYVRKEQAKQEQIAIKEQMRQEAEERKALEAERKKIEQEETKFEDQISDLQTQLDGKDSNDSEYDALQRRILELQAQLANVTVQREKIAKLQNGKAGNVYIISNLGSFGDSVFKIGMTRRMNPQDRVNELGDASVPFKFDVHSFIFSDDAAALETELHKRLNDRRVNKVNLRKEFFNVTIDELEELVNEICPTAEFTRTMLAEEYRQSQSTDEVYSELDSTDYEDE